MTTHKPVYEVDPKLDKPGTADSGPNTPPPAPPPPPVPPLPDE